MPTEWLLSIMCSSWFECVFVQGFMENEGAGDVPLEGSLPDMHSFTE